MPLVTRDGLVADALVSAEFLPPEALAEGAAPLPAGPLAIDWPSDRDPAGLAPWFDRIETIRVRFPAMGDGRGFSVARRLRSMGFAGRLRAAGPLIADQSAAAWAVGFDELEIPEQVIARQPEATWARGEHPSYRTKLGVR
jgi:uncharacterized protein (DUF934 family)